MKALRYALLGSLMSLSTCAITPSYADESSANKMFVQMLSPLVQINRNCSATLIQSKPDKDGVVSTLFLTAKHCTDGSKLIQEVYIPVYVKNRIVKEDLYRGEVFKEFYKADLSVIKLTDTGTVFGNVAKIGNAPTLYEGEDVWTVGYSAGQSRTITKGTFGNIESIAFPSKTISTEYYRATSNIVGGNSGGALFHKNDAGDYELIGVTTAVRGDANFMGYYTALPTIVDFLDTIAPEAVHVASSAPVIKTPGVN